MTDPRSGDQPGRDRRAHQHREHQRGHPHGALHDHGASEASDRRLLGTIALNGLLTVGQVVGGLLSGSVSLVADALHNLNDAVALVIVWVARRISRRRPDAERTFGYARARVVGALVNLVALAVVALFLAYESILRFLEPRAVDGWTMIAVAALALVVDVATVLLLGGLRKGGADARAAFVHNLSDAFASLAVMAGGAAILLWGAAWVDPLLSLGIVAYIAWQVAVMLPGVVRVLMESAPRGLELQEVADALAGVEGVREAHHLHAWLLDEERCALEAHLVIDPERVRDMERIKRDAREVLRGRFGITHATLEPELSGTAAEPGHARELVPDCV